MVLNFTTLSEVQVLNLHLYNLQNFIRHSHLLTPLGIILISVIRPFTFLPISFIALSITLMHRFWMSLLLINISSLISSVVVFFASRYFYEFLSKFIKHKVDFKWLELLEKNKFELVFFMRLSMLVHFDLLSMLAGISTIPFPWFVLASFIGFLPESILFSAVSVAMEHPRVILRFFPYILIYGIVIILLRKKLKRKSGQ